MNNHYHFENGNSGIPEAEKRNSIAFSLANVAKG